MQRNGWKVWSQVRIRTKRYPFKSFTNTRDNNSRNRIYLSRIILFFLKSKSFNCFKNSISNKIMKGNQTWNRNSGFRNHDTQNNKCPEDNYIFWKKKNWKFSLIILWFSFTVKTVHVKIILFPDEGRLAKFSKDDETHSDSWFSELRTFAALLCILVHTCRWFSHLWLRRTKNSKLN